MKHMPTMRFTALLLALLLGLTCAMPALAEAPKPPKAKMTAKTYGSNEKVTVDWASVDGAVKYRVLISKYPFGYDNVVVREVLKGDKNTFSVKLPSGKYACNLVATSADGDDSDYGPRVYFTVSGTPSSNPSGGSSGGSSNGKLATPQPYSNKAKYKTGETLRFHWKKVAGATSYVLYISKSPFGSKNIVVEKTYTGLSCELKLPAGRYAFNMVAYGSDGKESLHSSRVYLTVE